MFIASVILISFRHLLAVREEFFLWVQNWHESRDDDVIRFKNVTNLEVIFKPAKVKIALAVLNGVSAKSSYTRNLNWLGLCLWINLDTDIFSWTFLQYFLTLFSEIRCVFEVILSRELNIPLGSRTRWITFIFGNIGSRSSTRFIFSRINLRTIAGEALHIWIGLSKHFFAPWKLSNDAGNLILPPLLRRAVGGWFKHVLSDRRLVVNWALKGSLSVCRLRCVRLHVDQAFTSSSKTESLSPMLRFLEKTTILTTLV